MKLQTAKNLPELIGDTPVVLIPSLSRLTGCEIYLKCEQLNPGGSIKDRAALQMVLDALEEGKLKKGMTICEGTAGTGGTIAGTSCSLKEKIPPAQSRSGGSGGIGLMLLCSHGKV